jgi:hypothetical protein
MSYPIQSTQKLMFAQNPNYVFNQPHQYQHPVTQQPINQPIYKNPHVTIKPNVVYNPINQQPCACQRLL